MLVLSLNYFGMNAPRFISTIFYLLMGWALIFDLPAFSKVPLGCLGLIACGGISYTIGAIVYIVKKPNWFKTFGFHELFHIFVMIGSAFSFFGSHHLYFIVKDKFNLFFFYKVTSSIYSGRIRVI